jgi:hypothetical protein
MPNLNNTNSSNINDTFIKNPCYLKNYKNNITSVIGTGDYDSCYHMLHDIVFDSKSLTDQRNEDNVIYINTRFY